MMYFRVVIVMILELDYKEVACIEKNIYKSLKATKKNIDKTKDEDQKSKMIESIDMKQKLLKKLRQSLKENEAGR